MTELMTGKALHWCRSEQKYWRSWRDFCNSARQWFSVDREFQQRLEAEAIARTQGRNEPVTDYIICLRAIMDRMTSPWDFKKRLQLLYQNMLPTKKRQVPYDQVTNETTLLRLARDAEKLILDERNYVPPPPPGHAVFPELAYKEDSQTRAPQQPRSAVAAISAPDNADAKADLSTILSRLTALESSFAKTNKAQQSASKPNSKGGNNNNHRGSSGNKPRNDKPKQDSKSDSKPKNDNANNSEAEASTSKNEQSQSTPSSPKAKGGKKFPAKKDIKPDSDKNKDQEAGPSKTWYCYGCSWPGYHKGNCPECSENYNRDR